MRYLNRFLARAQPEHAQSGGFEISENSPCDLSGLLLGRIYPLVSAFKSIGGH
jgi:hypothetical protein